MNVNIEDLNNRIKFFISVNEKTTVQQLKTLIKSKTNYDESSQKLEIIQEGNTIVLNDDDFIFEFLKYNQQSQIVRLKYLGKQIKYQIIYYVEYVGPFISNFLCLLFLYKNLTSFQRRAFFMLAFHFFKRLYESKYIHVFSRVTAPLMPAFKNFIFYWIGFGVLVPKMILGKNLYIEYNSFSQLLIVTILQILFYMFELGNFYCHVKLRELRTQGQSVDKKARGIPKGMFFDKVISPNYSFEILLWLTFSFYTHSKLVLSLILLGAYIMTQWAHDKKNKLLRIQGLTEEERETIQKKALIFPKIL